MPEIAEAVTQHYLNALRTYNLSLVTTPDNEDGWERSLALYEMGRALSAFKAAIESDTRSNATI
jgi:hypothetical protein